ncbi:MAG: VacJ family lipoprotein [Nevskiaceae bacterium]|jgi:phospholipid-binding lipoprotein MlaA|nr:VacJ family lipoprotein [Nevskiaceae bacterium]
MPVISMIPSAARRLLLAACAGLLLVGCASIPQGAQRDARDPMERFNRSVYVFNDKLDRAVARPVARGYVKVVPQPMRTGVSNFFANLGYPTTVVNGLLQGKPVQFTSDLGRFLVNSTIGIGGLFDPATRMGLQSHDEDFGQTMAKWGMPSGPFLMLPVLGPSTLRDTAGDVADIYTSPKHYINNDWVRYGLYVPELIDKRAQLLTVESLQNDVYDPYSFMRNAWLQRREYLIRDGNVEDDDVEIDFGEDED